MPHLVVLCVVLIAVCGAAFYSQRSKRHLMAASFFEGMARTIEDRIPDGLERLAEWHEIIGFDSGRVGSLIREARELTLIARCLRAESNVLRVMAEGNRQATREYIDEWYAEDIQQALREGIYPSGLAKLVSDRRVYLEFIRIRNRYIGLETYRWKLPEDAMSRTY